MKPDSTLVIVNERAGSGTMQDIFRRAEHALVDRVGDFDVAFTEAPGHATRLAREALGAGVSRIVVAGGDGTINEVVNGWLDAEGVPLAPEATLAVLAGGTGGDLRKSLGIRDMDAAIDAMASGRVETIDVGRVSYREVDGAGAGWRYFVNVASMGFGGKVVHSLDAFTAMAGRFAYAAGAARAMLTWRDPVVRLRLEGPDGVFETEMPLSIGAIGNGRFFGGGMEILPGARLDDGLFHVGLIGSVRKLEMISLLRRVYSGTHIEHPAVTLRVATRVEADSDAQVFLDIDGEAKGCLPAVFEMVPGVLRVAVP
ncbi:MAG: diacylglycerol kinase family lipid kinase [Deltaproteobacteria bacterium]|nr:diacylglycerol kinase family lipid kinase [Deltaproteobacteria bacterium]MCB9788743.1 diacylglycerol kinase family lipid kinase [Deltaproteobacteria bacterium]